MLVTFKTDACGDVALFGEVALALLKMMGHTGTVPSAIKGADIPAALARLRAALDTIPAHPEIEPEGRVSAVSLAPRAVPLVALLTAAARAGEDVMWA